MSLHTHRRCPSDAVQGPSGPLPGSLWGLDALGPPAPMEVFGVFAPTALAVLMEHPGILTLK
jgi:hypothetical protein